MNANTKSEIGYGLLSVLLLCFLISIPFFLPACASAPAAANGTDIKLVIAQRVITDVVPAVLENNPSYEPALVAIADGVDLVFAKGTLSAEDVNAYIDLIGARYAMDPRSRLLIGNAILDLYELYQQTAGVKVASVTDPKFAALLQSFRDDVREGIRRYHVFKPAAK